MQNYFKISLLIITTFISLDGVAQVQAGETGNKRLSSYVNVFLGSSGDHGQLSPAASSPFGLLSIAPQTYPTTHMGYEYLAKEFLGFTHNRFEGTGCLGSGGNILIKPHMGDTSAIDVPLIKISDQASVGTYSCNFTNGITAAFAVKGNLGTHHYTFPKNSLQKAIYLDLGHAFHNAFVAESHIIVGNTISGWVDSRTTCNIGVFRTYYYLEIDQPVQWSEQTSTLIGVLANYTTELNLNISVSAVDVAHAKAINQKTKLAELASSSASDWENLLSRIQVKGDSTRENLFYSLLYRSIQTPYVISESDGSYRTIDGTLRKTTTKRYNGWAIWDNYKTQLPLLALIYPDLYQDMVHSIADLYPYGKKDFSTKKEPSNTVRTEHAVVVLLDAHKKGFNVDFSGIIDSLVAENKRLDFTRPDKALESAYDTWALAQVFAILGNEKEYTTYLNKALQYKQAWLKDFKDLSKKDVDQMSARKMYQGTIRQYRWSVPFDVKGLIELCGGVTAFSKQLDDFFENDYFNRANEPDLMAHNLYNGSLTPWKAQYLIHKFAVDTVVNHYFNDNSKGVGAEITTVYNNRPDAFLRTMDDDAGAMSSWFIFAALGLQPANIGHPIYYLHAPLFESIELKSSSKNNLQILVKNFNKSHSYVSGVRLNGKNLDRNWISHEELSAGGKLEFTTSDSPNKDWGLKNQWITDATLNKQN